MAYDLGGGATFNLGTNQDETTFAVKIQQNYLQN
jgi:hypothetical protein